MSLPKRELVVQTVVFQKRNKKSEKKVFERQIGNVVRVLHAVNR
jgi:hypothetical protein